MGTDRGIITGIKAATFLISFIFLALFLTVELSRGETTEQKLNLSEAVKKALDGNHELKAQMNIQFARREDIDIARSFLLPKVSLEERYSRTVNPGYAFMTKLNQERIGNADFLPDSLNHPDAVNDFQTTLAFEQPLFIKKAHIGLEMSKTENAASTEEFERKREETAFGVVQSYLLVAVAGGYVQAAEKAVEDAREHRRLAEVRYKTGLGLYSDMLRASTAVAEAEQKLVSTGKNLGVAKWALGLMIGLAGKVDVLSETSPLVVRDLDYFRAQAMARKDLKAMELRKENSQNNISLAEADYFPTLGVGGVYQFNDHNKPLGSEGDSWQLTAFLKWEIFEGAKRKHEKTKARYQAASAREYLEGMKKRISFQVEEAWLSLEEAKKNLELARESLKTAAEGSRLVKVRYEGSLSPIVDLLDAQVSFDHAQAGLVAREKEYQLAIVKLHYASGTLLRELAIE